MWVSRREAARLSEWSAGVAEIVDGLLLEMRVTIVIAPLEAVVDRHDSRYSFNQMPGDLSQAAGFDPSDERDAPGLHQCIDFADIDPELAAQDVGPDLAANLLVVTRVRLDDVGPAHDTYQSVVAINHWKRLEVMRSHHPGSLVEARLGPNGHDLPCHELGGCPRRHLPRLVHQQPTPEPSKVGAFPTCLDDQVRLGHDPLHVLIPVNHRNRPDVVGPEQLRHRLEVGVGCHRDHPRCHDVTYCPPNICTLKPPARLPRAAGHA